MKAKDIVHIFKFIINNESKKELDISVVFKEYEVLDLIFALEEKKINSTIVNIKKYLNKINIYNNKKEIFLKKLMQLNDDEIECLRFVIDNFTLYEFMTFSTISKKTKKLKLNFSEDAILNVASFFNFFENTIQDDNKKMIYCTSDIENKIHKDLNDFETEMLDKISDYEEKIFKSLENFKTKIETINEKKNTIQMKFSKYENAINLIKQSQTKQITLEKADYENIKKDLVQILSKDVSKIKDQFNEIKNEQNNMFLKLFEHKIETHYDETIKNIDNAHIAMKKTSAALVSSSVSVDTLNEILTFTNSLNYEQLESIIDEIECDISKNVKFKQEIIDNNILNYISNMKKELNNLYIENKKKKLNERKSIIDFFSEKMREMNKMMKKNE